MHGEVAHVPRHIRIRVEPLGPAGQHLHGSAVLTPEVVVDDSTVPGRRHHPLGGRRLALVEHRPEQQGGLPRKPGHGITAGHEHAIAHFFGGGHAFRPGGTEDDGHVDRTGGAVAGRLDHLHLGPLPLDDLAEQQATQAAHVVGHERPTKRLLAERVAPGESCADGDGDAVGSGQIDQRGDRRGVRHRVTQAWNQYSGAETDACRLGGRPCQGHPNVGIERW